MAYAVSWSRAAELFETQSGGTRLLIALGAGTNKKQSSNRINVCILIIFLLENFVLFVRGFGLNFSF